MTYLLGPYTSTILQLFQLSAAWIFYLGLAIAIIGGITLVSRTAIYKRAKEIDIHIRSASIEAIGLTLLVLGLVLAAPGADALSQPLIVGGGPSLQQCADFAPAACYSNGNTGACTGSNIGTASCTDNCTPSTVGTTACAVPSCIDNNGPICQIGTVTFTLTATNVNTQTITFSPGFSATPRFFNLYPPAAWPSVTVTTAGPAITSYCFICSSNSTSTFTWANMPVALTEIFSDLNRQHQITTYSGGWATTTFLVAVDCITGSTAGSPVLRVQWSTDDATWNDLANTPGAADMPVDNFVGCPSAGTIISKTTTVATAFPAAGTQVYFRVVGVGGGGAGDNPQFSWLRLSFQTAAKGFGLFCIFTKTAITSTTATVKLACPAVTTLTSIFNWYAEK